MRKPRQPNRRQSANDSRRSYSPWQKLYTLNLSLPSTRSTCPRHIPGALRSTPAAPKPAPVEFRPEPNLQPRTTTKKRRKLPHQRLKPAIAEKGEAPRSGQKSTESTAIHLKRPKEKSSL